MIEYWVTRKTAARILNVSLVTVDNYRKRGLIRATFDEKIKQHRYHKSDVISIGMQRCDVVPKYGRKTVIYLRTLKDDEMSHRKLEEQAKEIKDWMRSHYSTKVHETYVDQGHPAFGDCSDLKELYKSALNGEIGRVFVYDESRLGHDWWFFKQSLKKLKVKLIPIKEQDHIDPYYLEEEKEYLAMALKRYKEYEKKLGDK